MRNCRFGCAFAVGLTVPSIASALEAPVVSPNSAATGSAWSLPDLGANAGDVAGLMLGAIAIFCLLAAAIAPLAFAMRSRSVLTIIVSIVSLIACLGSALQSKTHLDLIVPAIFYATGALISVVMCAAKRIEDAIAGGAQRSAS